MKYAREPDDKTMDSKLSRKLNVAFFIKTKVL